jgi:hypothetical protein
MLNFINSGTYYCEEPLFQNEAGIAHPCQILVYVMLFL